MNAERIKSALNSNFLDDLAIGFIRYEAVRRMTVEEFRTIMASNIRGDGSFDKLVDEFIERQTKPSPASSAQANDS